MGDRGQLSSLLQVFSHPLDCGVKVVISPTPQGKPSSTLWRLFLDISVSLFLGLCFLLHLPAAAESKCFPDAVSSRKTARIWWCHCCQHALIIAPLLTVGMHPFHPSVICPWEGIFPHWLDCSCGPGWDLGAPIEKRCRNDQGIGGGGRWPCGAPPWTQPRGESSRAPRTGNYGSS